MCMCRTRQQLLRDWRDTPIISLFRYPQISLTWWNKIYLLSPALPMFTYCQINNTQQTSYTMKHELLTVHLKKTSWVCIVDHVVSAGHTCNSVYVCHTHICIQHSRQDALSLSELPQGAIFLQITLSFLTVRFCAPPQSSLIQELEQKHSISCLGTAAFLYTPSFSEAQK